MTTPYIPPPWQGTPHVKFWLEIVHSGVFLGKEILSGKSHFILGSDKRNVDLHCNNPSVSRQHLIFQFDSNGSLFAFDLSRHGAFRNGEKLPPRTFVEISNGDQLSFGLATSSRHTYIVCCEEESSCSGSETPLDPSEGLSTTFNCLDKNILVEQPNTFDSSEDAVAPQLDNVSTTPPAIEADKGQTTSAAGRSGDGSSHGHSIGSGTKGRRRPSTDHSEFERLHCGKRRQSCEETDHLQDNGEGRSDAGETECPSQDISWGLDLQEGEETKFDKYFDFDSGFINIERLREENRLSLAQDKIAIKLETKYRKITGLRKDISQLDYQMQKAAAMQKETSIARRLALEEQLEAAESDAEVAQQALATAFGWDSSSMLNFTTISKKVKQSIDSRLFDESDEFFDRTDAQKAIEDNTVKGVQNERTLKESKVALETEMAQLDNEIQLLKDEEKLNADSVEDPLDMYMAENAKVLKTEERNALQQKRDATQEKFKQVEKLLSLVQRN